MSNRNQIDGTLILATKLQMGWAGFRIKLLAALLGAVFGWVLMFNFRPPEPVRFGETDFNLRDALQLEIARGGIKGFYPLHARMIYEQGGLIRLYEVRQTYWHQFRKYGYSSVAGAIFLFCATTFWGYREKHKREAGQYVRGAQLVMPAELSKLVQKTAQKMSAPSPRLEVGRVLIPRRNEYTPWVIMGRPQVGKSTLIKSLLDQIINLKIGKRVVFDSKLDYTATHFQPSDLIFSPSVDLRSIRWTIFNDITSLSQIADMAAALIPEGSKDPIWSIGARLIFEGLLLHCFHTDHKTNTYLWQCACLPPDDLKKIFLQTPGAEMAAALLDKPEVATSFSFSVNLKAYLKPVQLLARMDGPFSIRQWLVDDKKDGLFIVSSPEHQEILRPLMNLFLSTLLTAHKSLPDDRERRIFYVLDELGVLPKVPGLTDALNFGPSKGLCAILGFQSYQQIEELYGRNTMESMLSAAGTNLIFSVGHDRTLESLSRLIGEQEMIEYRGTLSTGITDNRHGGSSMDQVIKKRLVLPDEIKDLPPLNAYMKMLGYPATRIKLEYTPYLIVAEANIPDPSFDLTMYLRELTAMKHEIERIETHVGEEQSLTTPLEVDDALMLEG